MNLIQIYLTWIDITQLSREDIENYKSIKKWIDFPYS